MHDLVKEVVSNLVDESREYDCPIVIKKVEAEGYLLSSKNQNRIVAVGILNIVNEDDEKEDMLGAFAINVKKYKWADAEGFSHDQMIDDLTDEIFSLMGVDEVIPYLCSK